MSLSEKSKNILSFFLRIAFSAALLIYLYNQIDTEKTLEVLKQSDPMYLILGAVLFFGINLVILGRWFIYIKALDLDASFFKATRYFFIGLFGNLFLPSAIGGDLIKILGLCKDSSQKPKVVASVVIDRLSGFFGIVIVAITAYVLGYRMINDSSLMYSIIVITIISGCVGTVLFNEKVYSFFCRIFSKLPRIKKALMDVHYDLALLKDKHYALWQGAGISCCAQVLLAIVFFLIAKALHQDVSFVYFLIFIPLICVAAAMPSIGGLGVREAGAAYLFAKVGVDAGVAVSISLISFLYMILVGLIGGIVYVTTISSRRVQCYQSDTDVSPKEA